jgi:N-acetylglucosamine kinase-like BadF-type ATPase
MIEQHKYVIGVDGGGSKTTAILCTLDGAIIAEAQGGPSNFHIVGLECTAVTILDLVDTCCHAIGCISAQIGALCAGLAGVGRPTDQQLVFNALHAEARKRNLILNNVQVEHDARIALEGAFNGAPGVIAIAGTGSIVYGKDERGTMYRAGGWGRTIGDEGSGFAIGREAFRAVALALDDSRKKTVLSKLFQTRLGIGSQESIIDAVYEKKFDIPTAAPLVIQAAEEGDRTAKQILLHAASELAITIDVVVSRMRKKQKRKSPLHLACLGGVLSQGSYYSRTLHAQVKRRTPFVQWCAPAASALVGAALLAIQAVKRNT